MPKDTRGALATALAAAIPPTATEAAATADVQATKTAAELAPVEDGVEDNSTHETAADETPWVRRLITGYRIEDALATNLTERKPKRKGDPSVKSRRLARVHYHIGPDDCPYWLGMASTINAITETFPDGSTRKRITISGPGAMVGDDTWYPCLALNGQRNATDPEMKAMLEEIRREWIAKRQAAVKAGTAAMAAKATKPDQVGGAELEALGLADFDAVESDTPAAAAPATK